MRRVNKNARTSSVTRAGVKGFTLIEMLLSTMLGGMVIGVVAFMFANMAGSFAEQPTTGQTFDWDTSRTIPYSPAYSQLPQAFALQAEISDCLQSTQNVAGGLACKSGGSPVTAIFVVSSDEGENLPTVPAADAADVTNIAAIAGANLLTSSAQFYTLLNPTNAATGYSIYCISDDNTVNMAVHCRVTTPVAGVTIYTVKTYINGDFNPELSYAYGLKNTNSSVNPSARHIKLRSNADWGIDEDIGTQVIFPDPTVLAYQIGQNDDAAVRTYSRFAVLLPIKP